MCKPSSLIKTAIAFFALCLSMSANSALLTQQQVDSLIEQADSYRTDQESAQIISIVRLYKDNKLDKTRQYNVYSRPERESLVVFKSAVEAGQKMLMLQDNFWLQMPKSRRPIRITPMQKLLGDASVGDISTLTWSQDYQGSWQAEEILSDYSDVSYATHRLELIATTKGASYQRIVLWLEKENGFPIQADLYLRSGKLAKQAQFTRGVRDNRLAVTAMTLLDAIQPNKKTEIEYQSIKPWLLEDKYYNPSFLARNNTSEL
ncbi:outer membrane lipoprotein-sorting protein [Vibrio sp. LaRot3]|uniref:outer membrane lipoprotein-sorting protein n=1 Tax=Vibrio sp. LaRot3 TaxID=2998829 RepID=UPI003FCD9809